MAKKKARESKETYGTVAKADNNNPATNPQLGKICEQLRDVRDLIAEDIATAIEENDTREILELLELDDRAIEVMNGIGCGNIARESLTDRFKGLMERFVFTEETVAN